MSNRFFRKSAGFVTRSLFVAWLSFGAASCVGAEDPNEPDIEQDRAAASSQSCVITYYQSAAKTLVVGRCFLPCIGNVTCTGRRTGYTRTLCGRC